MSHSDVYKVCAVAFVHLMETCRGCVIRAALIVSHDFILIFKSELCTFSVYLEETGVSGFISLHGSGFSKESNSRSFSENLFASCVEKGNISRQNLLGFHEAARLEHKSVIFINGIIQKSS